MSDWHKKKAREFVEKAFDESSKTSTMSAKEVEQAVLGALMIEKTAIHEVIDILTSEEFFYLEEHKVIYSCVLAMEASNTPIDLLTLNEYISSNGKSKEVGGISYLVELTNKVNSSAHIGYHSRLIMQHWIKRRTSFISLTANSKALDVSEDCFTVLDELQAGIDGIKNKTISSKPISLNESIAKNIKIFSEIKNNGGLLGVPTGIIEIDRKTGGAIGGDLVLVGARPGAGKSALKLILAHNAVVNFGIPSATFDYEDSDKQNDSRLIAMNTGYDYGDVMQGKSHVDFDFVASQMAKIDYSQNYFEYVNCQLHVLVSKIKMYVRKHKVGVVFINQLSFIKVNQSFQREDQMIGFISGTLKQLAKELNIPIYLFVQLNRDIDSRPDVRPYKADIRLASKLEEDADTIILLTRPEGYPFFRDGIKPYYYQGDIFDHQGKILIDYCKCRNGVTFEEWFNIEIGKHWLYGFVNPFHKLSNKILEPVIQYQIEEKTGDILKTIDGASYFE